MHQRDSDQDGMVVLVHATEKTEWPAKAVGAERGVHHQHLAITLAVVDHLSRHVENARHNCPILDVDTSDCCALVHLLLQPVNECVEVSLRVLDAQL